MKLKELFQDYVLIKVDEEKTKTDSGFYLQETIVKLPTTGVVLMTSKSVKLVKPGDRVEFMRYASLDGTEEKTRICREKHIIGIFSEDGKELNVKAA